MTKRDSYIKGATLLAGGMLIAKIIGAIYRIPLTNIIGAEGIGLYQLIFPVYALLITITGSGIPIIISRLIAERRIEGDYKGAKALFKVSLKFFMIIGLIAALILLIFSRALANIQANSNIAIGYQLIAPAILLSTGIAVYRGWFQGNMNMFPSAISQMTEQIIKLIIGLLFAQLLLPRGVNYAVWGAIISITLSELLTLIALMIHYKLKQRKPQVEYFPVDNIIEKRINSKDIIKELLQVMVPITLGGIMLPLVQFIDSLMIVNILKSIGNSGVDATKMYGILTGPVGSLINMPVVLTLAFAVTAIPVISSSRVKRDINSIRAKGAMSIKLTFAIGVPSSLALFALAEPLMSVLYGKLSSSEIQLAAGLMKVASLSIILLSIMQIYTALLQSIDRAYTPFINMAIGSVIKVALTIILIKQIGIYGAVVSTIIAYSVVAVLNIIAIVRWTGKNEKLTQNISTILFSGVIMSLSVVYLTKILTNNLIILTLGIIIGVIVYGLSLILMNTFTRDELKGMPLSRLFLWLTNTVRFWEKANDYSSRDGKE